MKTTKEIQQERIKFIAQFIDGGKSENRYLDLGNVIDILDNYSREPNIIEDENVQYFISNISRAVIHLLQRYEYHKEIIYDIGETSAKRQNKIDELQSKANYFNVYKLKVKKEFNKMGIAIPKSLLVKDEIIEEEIDENNN